MKKQPKPKKFEVTREMRQYFGQREIKRIEKYKNWIKAQKEEIYKLKRENESLNFRYMKLRNEIRKALDT